MNRQMRENRRRNPAAGKMAGRLEKFEFSPATHRFVGLALAWPQPRQTTSSTGGIDSEDRRIKVWNLECK